MHIMQADIIAMEYAKLIQAKIILNMRNPFLQNVSLFLEKI